MAGAWRTQEYQYLSLLKNIIKKGVKEKGRNGVTYTQIGGMMRFSLENNSIPLITTKKLAWRVCLKELLWFMNGDTDNKLLQDDNVKIWNGNATREFLDSRGLDYLDENDLGPVYGHQWRNWNDDEIDQIKDVVKTLKNNPNSRRMMVSAWNPSVMPDTSKTFSNNVANGKAALPPCHAFFQFYVADGKLSCQLYQRSADIFLGVPFNIASYALFTMMMAQVCGYLPGEFIHTFGDAHIYNNHVEQLELQLSRDIRPLPKMVLNPEIKDIFDFDFEDFTLVDYNPHPHIKGAVAV